MPKIRILIVDDSVVIRRTVADVLGEDPALEVVGAAANGRIALARLPQVNPDLVILDVEMPEMDGLTTLAELRRTYPRLPVIMFSALTELGAKATLDALALGATDYFTKPANDKGLVASLEVIRTELIPAIKTICAPVLVPAFPSRPFVTAGSVIRIEPIQIVAIGTSTGGPNALTAVFSELPADFPVPLVIVQHMPPIFTRHLADRLSAQCPIRVAEGIAGSVLQPGQAWIAPGDHHMVVVRDGTRFRLALNQEPPENSCRPAADVLFRSVAKAYGSSALAVVMTGMGQDGQRGCEAIKAAGGQVLVQDESTSVVWGMPGAVARAGLANQVIPLPDIAGQIVRRVVVRGNV